MDVNKLTTWYGNKIALLGMLKFSTFLMNS